jgi:hypothetical protein
MRTLSLHPLYCQYLNKKHPACIRAARSSINRHTPSKDPKPHTIIKFAHSPRTSPSRAAAHWYDNQP